MANSFVERLRRLDLPFYAQKFINFGMKNQARAEQIVKTNVVFAENNQKLRDLACGNSVSIFCNYNMDNVGGMMV